MIGRAARVATADLANHSWVQGRGRRISTQAWPPWLRRDTTSSARGCEEAPAAAFADRDRARSTAEVDRHRAPGLDPLRERAALPRLRRRTTRHPERRVPLHGRLQHLQRPPRKTSPPCPYCRSELIQVLAMRRESRTRRRALTRQRYAGASARCWTATCRSRRRSHWSLARPGRSSAIRPRRRRDSRRALRSPGSSGRTVAPFARNCRMAGSRSPSTPRLGTIPIAGALRAPDPLNFIDLSGRDMGATTRSTVAAVRRKAAVMGRGGSLIGQRPLAAPEVVRALTEGDYENAGSDDHCSRRKPHNGKDNQR